uniref:transmembrane protein 198-B-like isoform X2 n=1 Tax=Oncorhynchus gorbuscha TaxID=8017 RepID=UPI001EAF28D8|nr:transmembrane protein 198-B-like isoform X2 [Oncorhynchus gorbuscha]
MTSASWPQLLAFKLAPPPHDPGSPERILSCDEEIERRYEIVPSVACSMCCLFGIIYCFFGYRCFKAVMFLTGLMFGSVIIFLLCYKERVLDTQLSVEASVGIGLGIGTLCGLVTMLVRSVGLYMVGLLLGLLLGIASLVVMEEFHHPRTVWVPLGVLLGSGMLFAVLTLQWQRFFTTLSTAVFGSAVITVTVDYFIELFALVRYIKDHIYYILRILLRPVTVCWFTWVIHIICGILYMALLGDPIIQWKVTTERYSHTEVVLSRQQRRVQLMRIHQKEERMQKEQYHRPPPPTYPPPTAATTATATTTTNKPLLPEPITYHRKPNPIRRFDGDVLSPSYIASFRDRQVDRRDFPHHSRPIARHHMADRDYDCGSQVPLTAPNGPAVRV